VIHCFNGEGKAAGKYLDMGFYLSFTATITYPSSYRFAEDIRNMPRERILIETDCPFLPPQTQRGKRNEPAYVVYTARRLANIWNLPAESVQQITAENTLRLFKLRGLPSPS
jgi:TatD DNase family protein